MNDARCGNFSDRVRFSHVACLHAIVSNAPHLRIKSTTPCPKHHPHPPILCCCCCDERKLRRSFDQALNGPEGVVLGIESDMHVIYMYVLCYRLRKEHHTTTFYYAVFVLLPDENTSGLRRACLVSFLTVHQTPHKTRETTRLCVLLLRKCLLSLIAVAAAMPPLYSWPVVRVG